MEYGRYHIKTLCALLELLGFIPDGYIGDNKQIRYVHPLRERTTNRLHSYIAVPQLKSAHRRYCLRVLEDLDDFGFSQEEIASAAKKINLI